MEPLGNTPLVIFGAGGFGREVHEVIEDILAQNGRSESLLGFLDGNPALHGQRIHGLPVLGGADWLHGQHGTAVVIAVGSPVAKRRIALQLRETGAVFPTVIHPTASIGRRVALGAGNIVCPGCILTTDARTADFVTFNFGSTLTHDSHLGAYSTLAPYVLLSGNFRGGEGLDLGCGAKTIPGITIGDWAIVGAGAVVNRDLPANTTAVGVPARVIKERPVGWQL